jgi:hypothetical protein
VRSIDVVGAAFASEGDKLKQRETNSQPDVRALSETRLDQLKAHLRFGVSRSRVSSRAANKKLIFPTQRFALGCRLTLILNTLAGFSFLLRPFPAGKSAWGRDHPSKSSEQQRNTTKATPSRRMDDADLLYNNRTGFCFGSLARKEQAGV